jgi:hypothetical protein
MPRKHDDWEEQTAGFTSRHRLDLGVVFVLLAVSVDLTPLGVSSVEADCRWHPNRVVELHFERRDRPASLPMEVARVVLGLQKRKANHISQTF